MKIHIQAKSKKEINEMIAEGDIIVGTEYNAFNPKGYMTDHFLKDCETGTTVAIFQKYSSGSPYVTTWGEWDKEKNKVK